MSELTFLAYELPYKPLIGNKQPLWYHKGVCVFDREIEYMKTMIDNQELDIIIFQDWPDVDNYFPYEVEESAKNSNHYKVLTSFMDPKGYYNVIRVYIRN